MPGPNPNPKWSCNACGREFTHFGKQSPKKCPYCDSKEGPFEPIKPEENQRISGETPKRKPGGYWVLGL